MKKSMRRMIGVWEVDTMFIKGGYILVAVERVSKKLITRKMNNLKAKTMSEALRTIFSSISSIQAIICDRGSENAYFRDWQRMLHTRVYACDSGSPWQKGLVESSIRLLRKNIKNSTNYQELEESTFAKITNKWNNTYRVRLNGKTANQVFRKHNKLQFSTS